MLSRLVQGIQCVAGESVNTEMVAKIENWINDILMDANLSEENTKSDYLANVLLFSELLAATSLGEDDQMNVSFQ